jgi:hypothetical protein
MRQFLLITLSSIFLFNQTVFARQLQCENLFEKKSKITDMRNILTQPLSYLLKNDRLSQIPNRIFVERNQTDEGQSSVIRLTSHRPVRDTFEDSLEIANYLLSNPDVIVDTKGIFKDGDVVLSFPIINGYNIDVTYKSSARIGGHNIQRYLIKEFSVRSPIDVAELKKTGSDLYDPLQDYDHLKLGLNEISLDKIPRLKGLTISLDIPLELPGSYILESSAFNKLASYFNLFKDKSELKKLLETRSIRYIRTILIIKHQMESFLDSWKNWGERLGRMSWGPATAIALSVGASMATTDLAENIKSKAVEYNLINDTTIVERVFNGIEFPNQNSEILHQFSELKSQAKKQFKDKKNISAVPKLRQLDLDDNNAFSRLNKLWIVEKYDSELKSNRTYAALVIDSSRLNGYQTPEAFIMEIDPVRYQPLIQFVRSQGLVITQKNLDQAQKVEKNKGHKHEVQP